MKVLLVEDNLEQIEKAKSILQESGVKFYVAVNLEDAIRLLKTHYPKIDGVITDLHYPESDNVNGMYDNSSETPSGLSLIIKAISLNKPIVVCSDMNSHRGMWKQGIINDLSMLLKVNIPLVLNNKDWKDALSKLQNLLKN